MLQKIANWFGYPWLCRHNFEIINKVSIYVEGKRLPVGKEYHLGCTKCADVRVRKIVK